MRTSGRLLVEKHRLDQMTDLARLALGVGLLWTWDLIFLAFMGTMGYLILRILTLGYSEIPTRDGRGWIWFRSSPFPPELRAFLLDFYTKTGDEWRN